MTDGQIIKRCATAIGVRNPRDSYDPLTNGGDALELVRLLRIKLDSASVIEVDQVLWRASTVRGDKSAADYDLNRAICLLAAELA